MPSAHKIIINNNKNYLFSWEKNILKKINDSKQGLH
jgi:hypothetical protein